MKVKTVIKNLKAHRKWALSQSQDTATEKTADNAEDVLGGVLDLLDYLPPDLFDLDAWLDRKIRGREAARKHLDRIRVNFYRGQGKKAFVGLLDVVIEVLSSAAPFLDDVNVGCLPVAVRVPDFGGIGVQKMTAIRHPSEINVAALDLGIGDHQKNLEQTLIEEDDQSYQDRVLGMSAPQKHGVLGVARGQVSVLDQPKTCRDCDESLPRSEFYSHPSTRDRLQPECKACTKQRQYARRNGGAV
ncbi:hypothetical protein [Planctomycetes bacterium TBK1r]|uniref:Uncharacterized protein n=1 Tax=Stieleria magnilauensis TaxID=2527963 RepID=A0ABX5XJV0_9BACT|nr:hypothetical protein TBK1r_05850 [Planctomycetes bacterium TBK1r]